MLSEAKDDGGGGDNWNYKSCKAPVKSSQQQTNIQFLYRPDALPVAQPTVVAMPLISPLMPVPHRIIAFIYNEISSRATGTLTAVQTHISAVLPHSDRSLILHFSCPRFILASDWARPPVPTSWFLPHAGLHLATEHSRSQELEGGTRYRPVSPPHHLCPHSGDSWRHSFCTDNGVNNTYFCVVVLKCLALITTLILANWTELNSCVVSKGLKYIVKLFSRLVFLSSSAVTQFQGEPPQQRH